MFVPEWQWCVAPGKQGGLESLSAPGRGRPVCLSVCGSRAPLWMGMSYLRVALRHMELFSWLKDIMFLFNIYCLKDPYMHENIWYYVKTACCCGCTHSLPCSGRCRCHLHAREAPASAPGLLVWGVSRNSQVCLDRVEPSACCSRPEPASWTSFACHSNSLSLTPMLRGW